LRRGGALASAADCTSATALLDPLGASEALGAPDAARQLPLLQRAIANALSSALSSSL
jgi:hypothetical protein